MTMFNCDIRGEYNGDSGARMIEYKLYIYIIGYHCNHSQKHVISWA